jgi:hypothetical protein
VGKTTPLRKIRLRQIRISGKQELPILLSPRFAGTGAPSKGAFVFSGSELFLRHEPVMSALAENALICVSL